MISITKKCTNCGIEKPIKDFYRQKGTKDGRHSWCKLCKNIYKKKDYIEKADQKRKYALDKYYEKREELRAKNKQYKKDNKERVREVHKKWRERNRDKVLQYKKNERIKHIDKYKKYLREWYLSNKEKHKEYGRVWAKRNPEKVLVHTENRRARLAEAKEIITEDEWKSLLEKYEYTCLACGRDDVKITLDHVIPLSKGGENNISNIQPLCKSCNSKKGTKIIDYR